MNAQNDDSDYGADHPDMNLEQLSNEVRELSHRLDNLRAEFNVWAGSVRDYQQNPQIYTPQLLHVLGITQDASGTSYPVDHHINEGK